MPDRTSAEGIGTPPHCRRQSIFDLPFRALSWPILFRVELQLLNDRHGTLSAALEPIAQQRISILAIAATPAGHHHASVTIIGEALEFKEDQDPGGVLPPLKALSDAARTFRNESTWKYVHARADRLALTDAAQRPLTRQRSRLGDPLSRTLDRDPTRAPAWNRGRFFTEAGLARHRANRSPLQSANGRDRCREVCGFYALIDARTDGVQGESRSVSDRSGQAPHGGRAPTAAPRHPRFRRPAPGPGHAKVSAATRAVGIAPEGKAAP